MQQIRERYGEVLSPQNVNQPRAALYADAGRLFGYDVTLTADGTRTYVRLEHNVTGRDQYNYDGAAIAPSTNKFGAFVTKQGLIGYDDFDGTAVEIPIRIGLISPPITGDSVVTVVAYLQDTGAYQAFTPITYGLLIGETAQDVPNNGAKIADIYITGTFTEGDDITAQSVVVPHYTSILNHANLNTRNEYNKLQTLEGLAFNRTEATYNSSTRTLEMGEDVTYAYYDSGDGDIRRVDTFSGSVANKVLILEAASPLELRFRNSGGVDFDFQHYMPAGNREIFIYDGQYWKILQSSVTAIYQDHYTVNALKSPLVSGNTLTLRSELSGLTITNPLTIAYVKNVFQDDDIPSSGAVFFLRVKDDAESGFTVQHNATAVPANSKPIYTRSGQNETYFGSNLFIVTDFGTHIEMVSNEITQTPRTALTGTVGNSFSTVNINYKHCNDIVHIIGSFTLRPDLTGTVDKTFDEQIIPIPASIRPPMTIIQPAVLKDVRANHYYTGDVAIRLDDDGVHLIGLENPTANHAFADIEEITFSMTYMT